MVFGDITALEQAGIDFLRQVLRSGYLRFHIDQSKPFSGGLESRPEALKRMSVELLADARIRKAFGCVIVKHSPCRTSTVGLYNCTYRSVRA
jgi:hypothetical protein